MVKNRTKKTEKNNYFPNTFGESWEYKISQLEMDLVTIAQSGIYNSKKSDKRNVER